QEQLAKWVFPATTLESGGYLIVFASGVDQAVAGGELHTNFQLTGGGEYLALVGPDGAALMELDYPEQFGGVSYGSFEDTLQFFKTPSPGAVNADGLLGFVADTKFSKNRGYYDDGVMVEITSETEGVDIFYSIDGSDPSKGTIFKPAKKYTGPLSIDTTTVVRAVAKKLNWQSTNVDTHSYIFHDDVVNQPAAPDGFPDKWGRFNVDYEMDPDITGPNAGEMRNALRSLPTVSFVGANEDFFGTKGIYGNPESTGVEWEKPISFEWLNKDGSAKFQVDCGARIQGGFFRQASASEKHSFRLLFKSDYGVGRLRADIVDQPGAADSFDTIVFRAGGNDGYAWGGAGTTVQFLRDEFGRRIAAEAGHASPRGG
ncbi:MAG: chitobiase/beta-hexosaminidase C-terminal domain-containing protein, partial [Verrucomicrobiales bacterium]